MENEIWKDIQGYEGLYQVSNFGNVKSIDRNIRYSNNKLYRYREKILKQFVNPHGYSQVNFKGVTRRVHRLVATTFIPNTNKYLEVNHIDGNKLNNHADNLEWCTKSYNIKHAYSNGLNKVSDKAKKLSSERAKEQFSINIFQYDLNRNFIRKWESAHEIQRKLGINNANIIQVCKRKRKTAGGYIWRYAEEAYEINS